MGCSNRGSLPESTVCVAYTQSAGKGEAKRWALLAVGNACSAQRPWVHHSSGNPFALGSFFRSRFLLPLEPLVLSPAVLAGFNPILCRTVAAGRGRNTWASPEGALLFSMLLIEDDGRKLPMFQVIATVPAS